MSTWQEIRDNYITTPEDKAKVKQATQEMYDAITEYRETHGVPTLHELIYGKEKKTQPMDKGIIQRSAHDMVRRILEEWLSRAWSTLDGEDEDDKQLVSAMYEIVAYHELRGLPRVK